MVACAPAILNGKPLKNGGGLATIVSCTIAAITQETLSILLQKRSQDKSQLLATRSKFYLELLSSSGNQS